jgi:hypothetical protein
MKIDKLEKRHSMACDECKKWSSFKIDVGIYRCIFLCKRHWNELRKRIIAAAQENSQSVLP